MTHPHRAPCVSTGLRLLLLLLLLLGLHTSTPEVEAEYSSSKSDLDYEFGDYRGQWCLDDHGFVYAVGAVYYPGRAACPCTCTADGPVCVRPKCPRIHPRCTRIRYRACCPVCEAVAKVCVHGGKTYRLLEEFRLSGCEKCRCEANRQVYCSISDCPALHCVNPTYEPNHCCPVCKAGPNCFAGNRVIPAGERVNVDERTVCYCIYQDGTWHTHPQATCEEQGAAPGPTAEAAGGRAGRPFSPRLDMIP